MGKLGGRVGLKKKLELKNREIERDKKKNVKSYKKGAASRYGEGNGSYWDRWLGPAPMPSVGGFGQQEPLWGDWKNRRDVVLKNRDDERNARQRLEEILQPIRDRKAKLLSQAGEVEELQPPNLMRDFESQELVKREFYKRWLHYDKVEKYSNYTPINQPLVYNKTNALNSNISYKDF